MQPSDFMSSCQDTDLTIYEYLNGDDLLCVGQLNKTQFLVVTKQTFSADTSHSLRDLIETQILNKALKVVQKDGQLNVIQAIYKYYCFPKSLKKRNEYRMLFDTMSTKINWCRNECIPLHLISKNAKFRAKITDFMENLDHDGFDCVNGIINLPCLFLGDKDNISENDMTYTKYFNEVLLATNQKHDFKLVIKYLIHKGILDHVDEDYLLECACGSGNLRNVKCLLEIDNFGSQGFSVESFTRALVAACGKGPISIVEFLFQQGAQKTIKRSSIPCKRTNFPLMAACTNNQFAIAKLLLERGVNVDDIDDTGMTPLMSACSSRNTQLVSLLLEHGADPRNRDFKLISCVTHACKDLGITDTSSSPLATSSKKSFNSTFASAILVIQKLLDKSGTQDITQLDDSGVPLLKACQINSDISFMKFLLQKGCSKTINVVCRRNQMSPWEYRWSTPDGTALSNACRHGAEGSLQVTKCLIENGATVDCNTLRAVCQNENETAFAVAQFLFSSKNVHAQLLIDTINKKDEKGWSALMHVCGNYRLNEQVGAALAQLLIDKGADVNAVRNQGDTMLIWACSNCAASRRAIASEAIVKVLIDNGADVNAVHEPREYTIITPLLAAVHSRSEPIVRLLVEKGADIEPYWLQLTTMLDISDDADNGDDRVRNIRKFLDENGLATYCETHMHYYNRSGMS